MRYYRLGAHTKSDLKVHVVWIPKYRKAVLTGDVALRVRDLVREIAAEFAQFDQLFRCKLTAFRSKLTSQFGAS